MRVVVQLVKESSVKVNGVIKGEIENGFLVFQFFTNSSNHLLAVALERSRKMKVTIVTSLLTKWNVNINSRHKII